MKEGVRNMTSKLRYCWIRSGVYGVDKEDDSVGFATNNCQFRISDGIITEERFYCTHADALDKKLAEFCKPSLLRFSNQKKN